MTKKRIGTIYGSPIVEGDKNLKTSNEIHVSELGGEGGGSGFYLKLKTPQENEKIAQLQDQFFITTFLKLVKQKQHLN